MIDPSAPNIREAIDSRRMAVNKDGSSSGEKTYYVLQVADEQGALNALHNFAPAKSYGKMKLLNTTVEGQNGNTLFVVKCSYGTSDKTFLTDFRQKRFVPFWGWEQTKEVVQVPYMFRRTFAWPINQNTDAPKNVVTGIGVRMQEVTERRVRRVLTVQGRVNDVTNLDVIAEQTNKLHKIKNRWYRFIGGEVDQDQTDVTMCTLRYVWEVDEGTRIRATSAQRVYESYSEQVPYEQRDAVSSDELNFNGAYVLVPSQKNRTEKRYDAELELENRDIDAVGGVRTDGNWFVRYPFEMTDVIANGVTDSGETVDEFALTQSARTAPTVTRIRLFETEAAGWRKLPHIIDLENQNVRITTDLKRLFGSETTEFGLGG